MAKRASARCASCGRKGRPKEGSDYVCKRCQDGGRSPGQPPTAAIPVEDRTEQQLSAIRQDARLNVKGSMARKQTRKSVSVKALTEQRLKDHCRAEGRSVSGYIEEIVGEKLDAAGWPQVRPEDLPPEPEPEPQMQSVERDWDLPLLL